jgi:alanine racemase
MNSARPRSWVEIDPGAILHNLHVVRERIGPGPGIIAVVKANAYGHGVREVAAVLAPEVEIFAVASAEEAREIADFGRPIMLLGPCLPEERAEVVAAGWIPTVSSADEARAFPGGRINFKLDTGMGRIGCRAEDAEDALRAVLEEGAVEVFTLSTHLPVPDEDAEFTRAQLADFQQRIARLHRIAPGARVHSLNSAGILGFPEFAADLVRPGLILYGSAYPAAFQSLLRPALTWKTRVLLVRDLEAGRSVSYGRTFVTARPSRIAALGVGYADGFPRQASNRGAEVLVRGRRCSVVGRVTMDQILVDVTDVPAVNEGDEAVLVGRQGGEEILARELADHAGTIAWDIFTGLGPRVERFFLPDRQAV